MAKNVTIYTSNNCRSCVMVKQYLTMKGQNYSEVNIELNPERQEDMIKLSGVRRTPVVVVEGDDGKKDISVGYNLPSLASALQ